MTTERVYTGVTRGKRLVGQRKTLAIAIRRASAAAVVETAGLARAKGPRSLTTDRSTEPRDEKGHPSINIVKAAILLLPKAGATALISVSMQRDPGSCGHRMGVSCRQCRRDRCRMRRQSKLGKETRNA